MRKLLQLLLFFTLPGYLVAQEQASFCEKTTLVLDAIEEYHYQPKAVDDNFSNYVFETFFKRVDQKRLLFSQEDIQKLEAHKLQLDDYLLGKNCNFIDAFITSYKDNLSRAKTTLQTLEKTKLDFSGKDTVYFTSAKEPHLFSTTRKTLAKRWSKKVRIQMVHDYLALSQQSNFNKIKAQLKSSIFEENFCYIEDKLHPVAGIKNYIHNTFLDIMASYFDPHTRYFDATEKDDFMSSLATEEASIGVWFSKNNDGKIMVAGLQTGSTAWREKEINAGDLVLSLTANGETLETTCLSLSNLYAFVGNQAHQEITIKVLTKNTAIKEVTLKKEVLKVEVNAVSSYMLKGEHKIGYISLPSFYTDLEFSYGSANDIAKELFKLNNLKVDGLILDLRDNGGGSMKEAMDLSGMFIDKGPLGIYRDQDNNKSILKDFNRGTLFTKPLVILVNSYSASASEFLAAALQDHQRAVIVGTRTYGKGTAQQIIPLENTANASFLKITMEKMYRFTGKTHQAVGVQPDITLASIYDGIEEHEQDQINAIPKDTILKNVYFKTPETNDYRQIISNNKKRTASSPVAASIKEINADLNAYINVERKIPLTVAGLEKDKSRFDTIFERSKKISLEHSSFEVLNLDDYIEIIAFNNEKKAMNTLQLERIQKDYEIEECYQILNDLINIEK